MAEKILTLDFGTSGLKATLFSPGGQRIACALEGYPCDYPAPGLAQQQPEDYITAAVKAVRSLLAAWQGDRRTIAVIGLSGIMNGLIPVDVRGEVLYPNVIHSDTRAQCMMEQLTACCDSQSYQKLNGHRPDCHYTVPKLLWLKKYEPDIYRRSAFIINTKDYVYQRLTGRIGFTDPSDASLTGGFDIGAQAYSRPLLTDLGLDYARMPAIIPSTDTSATLLAEMADAMGLPGGIPVAMGGGDGACATRGSGIWQTGQVYNYIGSTAWVAGLREQPVDDDRLFHICDLDAGHVGVYGTVQTAASAFDWARSLLCPELQDDFYAIDTMIARAPAGSDGVFFLPYLMGDRTPHWDPYMRGGWVGASMSHDRSHLLRAVMEGTCFALRNALDTLEEAGVAAQEITLIGGGAKSFLWTDILAHIYARPVRIHTAPGEATSLGAAMAAGVGAGLFNWEQAAQMASAGPCLPTDTHTAQTYLRAYGQFNRLYPMLSPLYRKGGDDRA